MIKHNLLENRLNAVKEGKPIPNQTEEEKLFSNTQQAKKLSKESITQPGEYLLNQIYEILTTLGISILYGFGVKALLSADWKFLGILGVGIIVNQLFNIFSKLFKK